MKKPRLTDWIIIVLMFSLIGLISGLTIQQLNIEVLPYYTPMILTLSFALFGSGIHLIYITR